MMKAGTGDVGEMERPGEEMEAVLGVLVENAPVAMAMFDHQMRYVLANRSWVEEFSLQGVHPLIGRNQYEVFPGMHPGWRQVYDRALQGHVVRSEHDALSGPDGRRVVYRWEVRPWRRKKDASVGGLMVTCEKFGNAAALQALTAADEEPADGGKEGRTSPANGDLANSTLPMVLLDEQGIIRQTNAAATDLGLSKGIQEGVSAFWEVFADLRESSRLQLQWGVTLEKLAGECKTTGWVMELPAMQCQAFTDAQKLPPQRWLVTHCESDEGRRFLALRLPEEAAAARPNFPMAANLPAIANAVASISQSPMAEAPGQALELRRLQDELARARQELRTLHEAERTFTHRETRVRQYLDALPCGVLVLDELGTPLYQNEPLTKLLGRSMQKEETVESWLGAACPNEEHRQEVHTLWREDVWRRQLTRIFSLATADGLLKELEFQPSGLPGGGLLVCIQDATEHCRHEEQLRATEAKFRSLLHESPLPVVLMDKAGAVFEVNHLAESLLGHPKAELRRHPLDAWLEPADGRARREALRQLQEKGERCAALEVRVLQTDAAPMPVTLTLAQVMDSQGEPHCTVHFFQKKELPVAGAAPAVTVPMNGEVTKAAAAPTGGRTEKQVVTLLHTNVNGRIKQITPRGLELLGLTEAEAKGRALHLHFRPSDPTGFFSELTRLAQNEEPVKELACFGRDGERRLCCLHVVASGGGGFDFEVSEVQTLHVADEDLSSTAGGDASSQIPQDLMHTLLTSAWPVADLSREKLLLSETHHRIKNHLQIISSLLNLESNTITEPDARSALRSSQNRVRAIAELHQHLYQIALGTAESFNVFAEGLVKRLRDCYQITPERVAVELNLEEGSIQQEWMMPLALTLNETLSNCFEHAFPDDREGHVKVSLSFGAEGGKLNVMDDGTGLPPDFGPSDSTGLGLKILAVFAEQMRGKLSFGEGNSGGTEIQLRFPIANADI